MKITIPGTPISNMRPRLGKGMVYDAQSLIKEAVKSSIRRQIQEMPEKASNLLSMPACCVSLVFYFEPAKSSSKAKRSAKLANLEPCLVRKDLDNLEKFYLDCGTGLLYEDDHQVVELSSKKLWSEEARVEMEVLAYTLTKQGD